MLSLICNNRFLNSIPSKFVTAILFVEQYSFKVFASCLIRMTEHYTAARLMRQVFPKPSIIPPSVTVMLSKAILLDGPHSPEYSLPMVCDVINKTNHKALLGWRFYI